MSSMKVMIAGLAGLALAGCGGSEPEASSPNTAAQADAATATPSSETPANSSGASPQAQGKNSPKAAPARIEVPADLMHYHGLWTGRFNHRYGRVDHQLLWTPQGAIWTLGLPGATVGASDQDAVTCRVLFDTEGEALTYKGDDCPVPWGIMEPRLVRLDNSAHTLTLDFLWDGKQRQAIGFNQDKIATTPAAKAPKDVTLDILGVGLSPDFGTVDKGYTDNQALDRVRVEDGYGGNALSEIKMERPFSIEKEEELPVAEHYTRFYYGSSEKEGSFSYENSVNVFTTSYARDGIPFAITRRYQPDGTGPTAEAMVTALIEKLGEPSFKDTSLGNKLFWYYDTEGNQVRSPSCSYDRKTELMVANLNADIDLRPMCGYFFGTTIIGQPNQSLYSAIFGLSDVSRVVRPLLYREYRQYAAGFDTAAREIMEAHAQKVEKIEETESRPIDL